MLKYIKYFMAIFAVTVFTGCATRDSARVAASVDQDFVNVYDAFEMAQRPPILANTDWRNGCRHNRCFVTRARQQILTHRRSYL